MNVFNRIVMVLLILGLLALSAVMFFTPQIAMDNAVAALSSVRDSALFSDAGLNTYYLVGVAIIGLVLLILLILEIRKTRQKSVRIKTEGNGKARIGVDSVVQSLAYRIDELPGVRDAKARVTSRGNDVAVAIDLNTSPTVNVPAVTAQIVNLAHEIIETQLGVKIHGKVEVNVAHEPFPRGTMAGTAPKPEALEKPRSEAAIPPLSRPSSRQAPAPRPDPYPTPQAPAEATSVSDEVKPNGK
ncbi:MAG: alkaline shock response membrane anchor protein AmaP [Anaerolineae bacterium]